jgi:hypothetical protein
LEEKHVTGISGLSSINSVLNVVKTPMLSSNCRLSARLSFLRNSEISQASLALA